MLLTIITFIIILSILVFVHELGHFWVARRFGVRAEEFGFGFPPRAIGYYKSADGKWKTVWGGKEVNDAPGTVYSVNWIPLGGFVKIKGENGDADADPDSFGAKPIWQRTLILSAGVLMNFFLAAFLLGIGYIIGLPQAIDDTLSTRARISDAKIQVIEVLADSPAKNAGVEPGDVILSIDGAEFSSDSAVTDYVKTRKGTELNYEFKRGGDLLQKKITPVELPNNSGTGIGIGIVETGLVSYPWYMAPIEGVKAAWSLLVMIILAFYYLFKGLLMGQGVSADLAGPVGIAKLTGQVARLGLVYILQFASVLSVNLAVINFLPIPALDGGRVFFLMIEKFKGRPIKREIEAMLHNFFFILLIVLIVLITFRDISRLSIVGKIKELFWR